MSFCNKSCKSLIVLALILAVGLPQVHAAAGAQILSHTGYFHSGLGWYYVVGEVLNSGNQTLSDIQITTTFYNQSNDLVGTSSTYATVDTLLVGRTSPFKIVRSDLDQAAKIHNYSLSVSYSTTSPIPQKLRILSNSTYTDGSGNLHIIGEIKNNGTAQAAFVRVIATYYNSTGGVVATEYNYADPNDLDSNQTAPYDIFLSSDRTPYVHHYDLTADSTQYALVPAMDAYNYTRSDITPNNQIEQIMANNTYVFTYRNVTMMMNCSQNTEMNITIDGQVKTRIFAMDMIQNQTAMLTMNIDTSPPNGVQTMNRTLNFYWGLESNATLQLNAQLRLHVDGAALNSELGRTVDASILTWMNWNTTRNGWDQVPSWIDKDGYLVCNTTHFSTWTVAETEPATVQLETPWLTYGFIGAGMAVVAVVAIYLLKRR